MARAHTTRRTHALEAIAEAANFAAVHARERHGKLGEGRRTAVGSVHLLEQRVAVLDRELHAQLAEDDQDFVRVNLAARAW